MRLRFRPVFLQWLISHQRPQSSHWSWSFGGWKGNTVYYNKCVLINTCCVKGGVLKLCKCLRGNFNIIFKINNNLWLACLFALSVKLFFNQLFWCSCEPFSALSAGSDFVLGTWWLCLGRRRNEPSPWPWVLPGSGCVNASKGKVFLGGVQVGRCKNNAMLERKWNKSGKNDKQLQNNVASER